jgi:hypothetical protein
MDNPFFPHPPAGFRGLAFAWHGQPLATLERVVWACMGLVSSRVAVRRSMDRLRRRGSTRGALDCQGTIRPWVHPDGSEAGIWPSDVKWGVMLEPTCRVRGLLGFLGGQVRRGVRFVYEWGAATVVPSCCPLLVFPDFTHVPQHLQFFVYSYLPTHLGYSSAGYLKTHHHNDGHR